MPAQVNAICFCLVGLYCPVVLFVPPFGWMHNGKLHLVICVWLNYTSKISIGTSSNTLAARVTSKAQIPAGRRPSKRVNNDDR